MGIIVLLVIGFVIYKVLKNRNAGGNLQAAQQQPLLITQEGDWSVISGKSVKIGRPGNLTATMVITIIVSVLICVFGISILMSPPNEGGSGASFGSALMISLMWAMCAFAFGGFFWLLGATKWDKEGRSAHAQAGPFAVRPDGIRTPNGAVVPAPTVYRIRSENLATGQVVLTGTNSVFLAAPLNSVAGAALGVSSALIGGVGMAAQVAINKWRRKIQDNSYAVVAEHSGTSTVLASGLTSELAYAVYRETIARLDGFH